MKIPPSPPDVSGVVNDPDDFERLLGGKPEIGGRYLHWEDLRRRQPPRGLTHQLWWASTAFARGAILRDLPLRDASGRPFCFAATDIVQRAVHEIDRDAAGQISLAEPVTDPDTRDRYIVSSLIEEAITSSQLEGASVTREVAKEMLRSGRKPRDRDEQMIANNYRAMERIREECDQPLTRELVLELHRIVTLDTLDRPDGAGRFRRADETIRVVDDRDGEVLHVPPPAGELPERVDEMCRFANGETPESFVHPVVRAILLHFWLAYDHPFVDGNGRAARALFYWSMVRQGYWLTEFLSISRVIKKAPTRYERAFLHTETDRNDTTYFVIHQLGVIREAIDDLLAYVKRKMDEARSAERALKRADGFNHRQLALLVHALRHPDTRYTVASHQRSHGVVYETARKDLLDLEDKDLLHCRKSGKKYVFTAPEDLDERLAR